MDGSSHFVDMFGTYHSNYNHPEVSLTPQERLKILNSQRPPDPMKPDHGSPYDVSQRVPSRGHEGIARGHDVLPRGHDSLPRGHDVFPRGHEGLVRAPEGQQHRAPESQQHRAPEGQQHRAPEGQQHRAHEGQQHRAPEGQHHRGHEGQIRGPEGLPRASEMDESVFNDFMRTAGSSDLKMLYDNQGRKKLPDVPYMSYDKKTHKCEYCGATFSLKTKLDAHIVRHTGKRVYACEVCGSLFTEKEEVETHIELVHNKDKPYKCGICGAGFILSNDLKVHENIHTWDLSFRCDICGKSFSKAQGLQKHKAIIHADEAMHVCKLCNATFPDKDSLESHFESHDMGLECTLCGLKFPTQSKLIAHGYSHAGKKPYLCNICDAVFGQKGHLKRHMSRKHPKEKILECILCDASFVLQEDFDKHQKVHSSSTTMQCKYCKIPFSSIVTLSMHIAQDHSHENGENPRYIDDDDSNRDYSSVIRNNQKPPDMSRSPKYYATKFPEATWQGGNQMSYPGMDPNQYAGGMNQKPLPPQGMYGQPPGGTQQLMDYSQGHKANSAAAGQLEEDQIESDEVEGMDDKNEDDEDDDSDDTSSDEDDKDGTSSPKKFKRDAESDALLKNGMCTVCGATFVSKSNLIRHYSNVHNINTPLYNCSQCPEKFHKKRDLDVHMHSHGTLLCNECGAKFPTESQLKRHSFIHTGEKPFNCKFCPAAFEQKSHLRRHTIQRHLQEKSHACNSCDATFVLKSELKKHERSHSGSKAAVCKICGSQFALVVGLKRHLKLVHGEGVKKAETDTSGNIEGKEEVKDELKDEMPEVDRDNMSRNGGNMHDQDSVSSSIRKDHSDGIHGNKTNSPMDNSYSSQKDGDRKEPPQTTPMSLDQPLPLYNPQAFMWPGRSQESYGANMDINRGYFPETCMYSGGGNKTVPEMARQIGTDQPYNPLSSIEGYPFYGSQYFPNAFNNRPGATGVDNRYGDVAAAAAAAYSSVGGLPGMNQNPGLLPNLGKNSAQQDSAIKRATDEMLEASLRGDDLSKSAKQFIKDAKPEKKPLEKTFKCDCGMMFSSRSHLLRHSSVHSGLRPFACRECDSTFAQKDHLRRHIRCMHVGARPFKCDTCGANFSQKCNLLVHVKVHQNENVHKCEHCDTIFKKETTLQKHIEKVHLKIQHIKCKVCKEDFTDQQVFIKHQETHNKPQECNECLGTFQNEAQFLRHSCFYSVEKPFKCDLCNASFSKHSHLKKHTIQKHIDDNLHICSFCDAGYVEKEDLEKHEKEHDGEKLFTCDICSISFPNAKALKAHGKDAHTEDKSFVCKFCGDSYSSAFGLKKHEKIHKDEVSYKCEECDEEFAQKASLQKHMRDAHSKRKQYHCETCSEKFTNKAKLRDHSRIHVQELGYSRKYSCEICNELFRKKNILTDHKNKKHFSDLYLECGSCGVKFRREHQLKKHQKEDHDIEYVEQKSFQCTMCELSFSNISGLTIHNRSHKGMKVYVCDVCNETYPKEDEIKEHIQTVHTWDSDFDCLKCDMKFSNEADLQEHKETCIKDEVEEAEEEGVDDEDQEMFDENEEAMALAEAEAQAEEELAEMEQELDEGEEEEEEASGDNSLKEEN